MKIIKQAVGIALFFAFLCSFLPFPEASAQTEIPDGYTEISDRASLEAITLAPDGKYFLTVDLSLGEEDFTPLCTEDEPFTGIFDGNGHTVYGMSVSSPERAGGLFAFVSGGTVTGLTVSGSVDGVFSGLIAGKMVSGSVLDCTVRGSVSGRYAGGIVGQVRGDGAVVSGCASSAEVSLTGSGCAGGICGAVYGGGIRLENSTFAGMLSASGDEVCGGGIAGDASGDVIISGCTVDGGLSGDAAQCGYFGGIAGAARGAVTAERCVSSADLWVTCTEILYAGGLIGQAVSGAVTVTGGLFDGSVTASGGTVIAGGVLGGLYAETGTATAAECFVSGEVEGNGASCYAGGIVGLCRGEGGSALIRDCRSSGAVKNPSAPALPPQVGTGGIVGMLCGSTDAVIEHCLSFSAVQSEIPLCVGSVVGALWGYSDQAQVAVRESCYFGGTDPFGSAVGGDVLSDPASYPGFDFESVWQMDPNAGLPILRAVAVPQTEFLPGDADGSGRVTRADAELVAAYLTGRAFLSEKQLARCDADGDGSVTALDVMMILRAAANAD